MNQPEPRLSSTYRFFIIIAVIIAAAVFGYRYFHEKTQKVELYDEMYSQISTVRVSISKFEYLLDMYVVARRFENTTVDIIKSDVRVIDENISRVLENRNYQKILRDNKPLSEVMTSIGEDWLIIKNETKRLNTSMPQDEIILTHNAVDMNAIVVTEKIDRLLASIAESRKESFNEAKGFVLRSALALIVIFLTAVLVYYRRVIRPLDLASRTAEKYAKGDFSARIKGRPRGAVGAFIAHINSMLDSVSQAYLKKLDENREIKAALERKTTQIKSIDSLMHMAGRTLSQSEFFNAALREAVCNSADAAAIYSITGNMLKLKASSGFEDAFLEETAVIGFSEIEGIEKEAGPRIFSNQNIYPSNRYWSALRGQGFSRLICVPLVYNDEANGFLYAAFRDEGLAGQEDSDVFIGALGSCVSVVNGHLGLFLGELGSRKFFERVLNQMPSGIAIFERAGICRFMSLSLRQFMGADQRFDPANGYNLFEDGFLASHGMLDHIRKTFDGYPYESICYYDPAVNARFGFSGHVRKTRLRSLPMYDAGGEITSIMLIYDGLADPEDGAGHERPKA